MMLLFFLHISFIPFILSLIRSLIDDPEFVCSDLDLETPQDQEYFEHVVGLQQFIIISFRENFLVFLILLCYACNKWTFKDTIVLVFNRRNKLWTLCFYLILWGLAYLFWK